MKLEDKIADSEVTFIHSMEYNGNKKQFDVNLVKNPRLFNGADKRLTFDNVRSFQIDEETYNSPDQIRGISEYREGDSMKYVFMTEQRTFMLSTDKEPLLVDL
ncbi:MAG TPA: hypothetical protein VHO03_06855 [Ignavibacteriales bacterium]|nr:hypothetical protein [Ignavibacteriales bacterium]